MKTKQLLLAALLSAGFLVMLHNMLANVSVSDIAVEFLMGY